MGRVAYLAGYLLRNRRGSETRTASVQSPRERSMLVSNVRRPQIDTSFIPQFRTRTRPLCTLTFVRILTFVK